jgi:hypothetical protein
LGLAADHKTAHWLWIPVASNETATCVYLGGPRRNLPKLQQKSRVAGIGDDDGRPVLGVSFVTRATVEQKLLFNPCDYE